VISNGEHANTIYHALNRILSRLDSGELDLGYLLRDAGLVIPSTAKRSDELRRKLEQRGGGVIYMDHALNRLLATCKRLLDAASSGELASETGPVTREEALDFVFQALLPDMEAVVSAIAGVSEKGAGRPAAVRAPEGAALDEERRTRILQLLVDKPVMTDRKLVDALEVDYQEIRSSIKLMEENGDLVIFHESADEMVVGKKP